ncbi:MAG: Uma2 family endonuclease [Myxococcota bacterium]
MTAARRPRYTPREYIEIEDASVAVKHECVRGEIYAMSGGSPQHAALTAALVMLVGTQLRGGLCRAYSSDLRISIPAAEVYTDADMTVVGGEPPRDPGSLSHGVKPKVVFEVLSPRTER